jgi:xylulose-5-phosphate/fructose-6-phosphate phosphoketolase
MVVAGKHALPQWLTMDAAVVHCTEGIGIWQWASNDQGAEPDVVDRLPHLASKGAERFKHRLAKVAALEKEMKS